MNARAQAEMDELGKTPEELAEIRMDLSAKGITGAPGPKPPRVGPGVALGEIVAAEGGVLATKQRRTRSDKGKPRQAFFVSIPGVRFDMATDQGREAFFDWITNTNAPDPEHLRFAVNDLLREIDRLRAK